MILASTFVLFLTAQAPDSLSPASIDRIQDALGKTPPQSLKFDVSMQTPSATFRRSVNERVYMPPFLQQLRKQFELSALQRQSAEWASKCCGLNLLAMSEGLRKSFRRAEVRRAHDQVLRELGALATSPRK